MFLCRISPRPHPPNISAKKFESILQAPWMLDVKGIVHIVIVSKRFYSSMLSFTLYNNKSNPSSFFQLVATAQSKDPALNLITRKYFILLGDEKIAPSNKKKSFLLVFHEII